MPIIFFQTYSNSRKSPFKSDFVSKASEPESSLVANSMPVLLTYHNPGSTLNC